MKEFEDNEIPYRSPMDATPAKIVSDQDEDDFSTLIQIQKDLNQEIDRLSSIDVFDLAEAELSVKEQIAAYRKAKEILEPIQGLINETVNDIKLTQKGKHGAK